MSSLYDIVVVGSGPAGLTAALYARRAGKTVLVLEKENFGGQITYSPNIENYPSERSMSGAAFAEKLLAQVQDFGAVLELDTVRHITPQDNTFQITGEYGCYTARAVILATGSRHRMLGLPHEEELVGAGVCYCAVCDGAFYKNQHVAIVGGGNTALQDAVLLSDLCTSVTIVQNLPDLTGDTVLQEKVARLENVRIRTNTIVSTLHGDSELQGITIRSIDTNQEERLDVTGLFVAIGQIPETKPFARLSAQDSHGYIIANEQCLTDTPGIFVAGDCRTKPVRQIVTATADGATAAFAACQYLDR